jgi:hypothetical protein
MGRERGKSKGSFVMKFQKTNAKIQTISKCKMKKGELRVICYSGSVEEAGSSAAARDETKKLFLRGDKETKQSGIAGNKQSFLK